MGTLYGSEDAGFVPVRFVWASGIGRASRWVYVSHDSQGALISMTSGSCVHLARGSCVSEGRGQSTLPFLHTCIMAGRVHEVRRFAMATLMMGR